MVFNYNGVKIFYKVIESEKQRADLPPLLLLHGWGADSSIFESLVELLDNRKLILLDFPPFGESKVEPVDWNAFTYANMTFSLCQQLGISKVDILGHSFGGRIAIILSALQSSFVNKLILIDSAGLKPRRGLKYHFKVKFYKLAKRFGFIFQNSGSNDYKQLSVNMKKVFVEVVNLSLDDYLPLIKQKTLILFGEQDKETPIYMAKKLNKKISNSKLIIIKGGGHFCFLDNLMTTYRYIDEFLEG